LLGEFDLLLYEAKLLLNRLFRLAKQDLQIQGTVFQRAQRLAQIVHQSNHGFF
jgi:hypothetical protein